MFGFGRSSNEKAVINLFALQFESLDIPSSEAVRTATKLVDEVLADLRPHGIDPFKTTQGNEYAAKEAFLAPRLLAGLTTDDIRFHWNRPLLVPFGEMKMRQMFNFIVVDMARQQGKDTSVAALRYKKTFPRYGDPSRWDPKDEFNIGLCDADADLYPEFANRVDSWQRKTSQTEVEALVTAHGTLNAAIRHQVVIRAL
jgi:hypothetical protein